ncbi:MAG TPA: hypothetical protein VIR27_15965 [Mycobacteriales bacterium]|jgi:hypothetical protein
MTDNDRVNRTPMRTYDDWPGAAGGPTVRHAPSPQATPPDRLRAFTDAVLELHQVSVDRFIPMCSCGNPARHCPIVRAEHEVLGIPMPFTFDPPRLPYHEV